MLISFEEQILKLKDKYFKNKIIEIIDRFDFYLKLKIIISDKIFISVRYNQKTERKDFALIKNNQRIIGFDNLGGWHKHPFKKSDSHIFCDEPSMEEILREFLHLSKYY